ncbi:MAG: CDP-alcohol phosphatidyltransferase family protein [Verrucomicrobia bacterium]|nr:CDP-alcohol phosphatidyltransferase family protein [Kiritimatiellia bacterium]MCP5489095.1 CDP-alcohol phosphatidyltransferase family protein [Verrucomicrobiota bacterium]
MEKTKLTLATRITLLRILGVPVFVVALVYYLISLRAGEPVELYRQLAAGIFILVAATDAVDGYIARKRNEITALGTFLDPIADKGLMIAALILLTRPNVPELSPHLPLWFTALVISRDVILIAGSVLLHLVTSQVKVKPHWTGKLATALQMLTILLVLLRASAEFFEVCLLAAATFTAISGARYILDGLRQMERSE